PYGLSAAVMASDAEHARRVGEHIETGMVYINEPAATSAELPFGGYKRSGIGRELGRYGMEEFGNNRLMKFGGEISAAIPRNYLVPPRTELPARRDYFVCTGRNVEISFN